MANMELKLVHGNCIGSASEKAIIEQKLASLVRLFPQGEKLTLKVSDTGGRLDFYYCFFRLSKDFSLQLSKSLDNSWDLSAYCNGCGMHERACRCGQASMLHRLSIKRLITFSSQQNETIMHNHQELQRALAEVFATLTSPLQASMDAAVFMHALEALATYLHTFRVKLKSE